MIRVIKKGVEYSFVPKTRNENFYRKTFANWENETFHVFDLVKNPNGVALDIGGWVGTTSIWLSKHFQKVITVEADVDSVNEMQQNLNASGCDNVEICDKAIYKEDDEKVVFGGRRGILNTSVSMIKAASSAASDYSVATVKLSTLVGDHNIQFIKCDIEGGEEHIMEDLFEYAFTKNINLYMSFHYSWFANKNLDRFREWFDRFKFRTFECVGNAIQYVPDIVKFLQTKPFGSILFAPNHLNMTVVVPAFNNYTFVKNTVKQLEKFTKNIVVVDNASTYQPLLDYYSTEYPYRLVKCAQNFKHHVAFRRDLLGITLIDNKYLLTDPDLQFNPNLPDNFIEELFKISKRYQASKVGFALDISTDINPDLLFLDTHTGVKHTVVNWESRFWKNKKANDIYVAAIDTIFCMFDVASKGQHLRVAGNFTAQHIPWILNFDQKWSFLPDELEYYRQTAKCSNWIKK